MKYEELVHNLQAIAQNTIISMAKEVEDNILHMIIAPIIVLQPAVLQNPVTNPPWALYKAPNALVIK